MNSEEFGGIRNKFISLRPGRNGQIVQANEDNDRCYKKGSFVFRAKILGSEVHNADESSAKSSAGFDSRTPFVLNV